jgi:hypothetical protein
MEMKRLDESLSKETLFKSRTGRSPTMIDASKIKVSGSGNIQPVDDMGVCKECGAVHHGNLFCNTCRNVANAKLVLNLPPWPHPAMKPCDSKDIKAFIKRFNKRIRGKQNR